MRDVVEYGHRVLLAFEDGSHFIVSAGEDSFGTHKGVIDLSKLIGAEYGSALETAKGEVFFVMRPRFVDDLFKMKRRTQIVYPKDMAFIIFMMDVKEGDLVIDAGVGSAAMCGALARSVGNMGRVFAYERRKDFYDIAKSNLEKWGLLDRVELKLKDISEGFDEKVNAIFLDVPDPWNYISNCSKALLGSGNLAIVCPTTNQVQKVIEAIESENFIMLEIWESLFRKYKPVSERLRPFDRMVAHTAYMIFARKAEKRRKEI